MIQVTLLTVRCGPKTQVLKFNEVRKVHPWVIPIGLDFYVISTPSK